LADRGGDVIGEIAFKGDARDLGGQGAARGCQDIV
jgi:hypothetical protein